MPDIIRNSSRLGRRPVKQGPRSQLSDQGWVDKLATERFKPASEVISVGTWNVRTLWATGKLELLKTEMKRYRCDILGLAEMRWTGSGEIAGGEVIWSGDEKKHEAGVGFLLSKRARQALLGYRPVNARIMVARFEANPFNISVIQVYATTADSSEEESELFYNDLTKTIQELPKRDIWIITGDWNAKIGTDRSGYERVMGTYGLGDRNKRGEKLLEFAMEHEIFICNTKFQQKKCRKWTWRSPDGRTKNLIDFIMISRKWMTSVQQCRSFQGADIDSDHSLVIANIKLRLKRRVRMPFKKQRDLAMLAEPMVEKAYKRNLEERIKNAHWKLTDEQDIDKRAEGIAEAIRGAIEETIPEKEKIMKKWITETTLKLVQEKRTLKTRRDMSDQAEREYRSKCNEVKSATRKDKQRWLEEQCELIQKHHGEHRIREAYKLIRNINRKWNPKQMAIKDKNDNVVMEKEKVLQRWTEYCRELYKAQMDPSVVQGLVQELKEISPPTCEREGSILKEEVERAIMYLKNNKSPGTDLITGEMIKSGGETLIEEMYKLCNMVWNVGKVPNEWTKSLLVLIHKKGSMMECTNYRTVALLSHLGKVLMMILTERLRAHMEEHLADEQAGFRKDRSTIQQILALKLIAEKARRKNKRIYNCFIDFQKAFDSIDQTVTWAVLESYGVDNKLIKLLKNISDNAKSAIRIFGEIGSWFETSRGSRQGDNISPTVFISDLERAMDKIKENVKGISIHGLRINNLRYADDVDIIEENETDLEETVQRLSKEAKRYGLIVNIDKTKTMVFGQKDIGRKIQVDGIEIENVENFTYLGSNITYDMNCKKEVTNRAAKALGNMQAMEKIWRSRAISIKVKKKILETCIFSCFLYGCETWTITKEVETRILTFERKCYRKMLRIGWIEKISNEEVYKRIQLKETLLQKVKRRKLGFFGHICRMKEDRKIKTLLFGIMDGANKRGRPHREWTDDIKGWCGKNLQELRQRALDREKWRKTVKLALDTDGR